MQAFYQRQAARSKPCRDEFCSVGEARLFVISFFIICISFSVAGLWALFDVKDMHIESSDSEMTTLLPFWVVLVVAISIIRWLPHVRWGQRISTKVLFNRAIDIARWPPWLARGFYAYYVMFVLWFTGAAISFAR